jgi:hypothetical protein
MRTWIFQANPKRFDVAAWLATAPVEFEWLVSRYADQISIGDRVFLWRSEGDRKDEPAGIFAEAITVSTVRDTVDDGAQVLWADPHEATQIKPRVRLTLQRVANRREVIKRDWWKADPVLRDHLIMRMPNHTTFALDGDHLTRLDQLWSKTGSDWGYDEAVAALFAFVETHGGELSKLPGSVVANLALQIGRPVSGAYNAVLNFRSLDPSDLRKGLDGASAQLKQVWAAFWSEGEGLDAEAVRAEYQRLWSMESTVDAALARELVEAESEQLAKTLTYEQLLARWQARQGQKSRRPAVSIGASRHYDRDPLVAAIARRRSGFHCEVPGCTALSFVDRHEVTYVEVHHIHMLADGGDDTPENVVCLCPGHHREAHHGKHAKGLVEALRAVRAGGGSGSV